MGSDTHDMRRYIEDAHYPARAQDLLAAARSSDASEGILERLGQLPTNAQFSNPDEVVEELENPEVSSEDQAPPGEPVEA